MNTAFIAIGIILISVIEYIPSEAKLPIGCCYIIGWIVCYLSNKLHYLAKQRILNSVNKYIRCKGNNLDNGQIKNLRIINDHVYVAVKINTIAICNEYFVTTIKNTNTKEIEKIFLYLCKNFNDNTTYESLTDAIKNYSHLSNKGFKVNPPLDTQYVANTQNERKNEASDI